MYSVEGRAAGDLTERDLLQIPTQSVKCSLWLTIGGFKGRTALFASSIPRAPGGRVEAVRQLEWESEEP